MNKYLLLSLILVLTSCHVGNDYEYKNFISDKEVMENLNITSHHSNKIQTDWYKIFNDSDLNTLLRITLKQNLTLKQALEQLKQSRYAFQIYAKDYYPMLDVNGGYNFNKVNQTHAYAFDTNIFKIGLDASWELDIWGKGNYISEQYFEIMNNVSYSVLNLGVSITAEMVQNYINLRLAQEKLYIAQHNLKLQRDILKIVKDKLSAGVADELDLNQAQFAVEATKTAIPYLKTEIENYKNSIAVLLGVLPNKLPVNLDSYKRNITATTFRYDVKKLHNLPLSVIKNRPDIMATEAMIKSKNAKVNEAIASLYPTLSLGATFGFISPSGHSLFNNNSQIFGYSPQLSLPIWNWNQLKNNIELQKHIKEEYLLSYNEAMLTALAEIKNSITAVEQSYKSNLYNQNSYLKMKNIMELTKEKYKNGLVDFTDVALAEQNLLKVQNDLANSNAQILRNLTAFYKAVGGGYNFD